MHEPRTPQIHEFNQVVDFLNFQLREKSTWSISSEYPTALTSHNIHNMSIILDDEKIISHAVLKTLIIKTPLTILKVGAIGSVVTDPAFRNQGLTRKNIENCLHLANEQECDLAVLWTDQFDLYRKFGFELAGFDFSYIMEDLELSKIKVNSAKNNNIKFLHNAKVDPDALLKLYSQHTVHALRNIEDFRHFLKIPNSNLYTAWSNDNKLLAYAAEGKGLDLLNYVHEWGGQVEVLTDLFHFIHDLKKSPLTIMTPYHSHNLRKQLAKQCQFTHEGFLGMLKIINLNPFLQKIKKIFRTQGFENFVLEKQENLLIFGFGTDLYTLNNTSDLLQIIFGPTKIDELEFINSETKNKLSQILPLPLWIWGWDSI